MATIEYWIQIENHPWDVCPNNIDRITGMTVKEAEDSESPRAARRDLHLHLEHLFLADDSRGVAVPRSLDLRHG